MPCGCVDRLEEKHKTQIKRNTEYRGCLTGDKSISQTETKISHLCYSNHVFLSQTQSGVAFRRSSLLVHNLSFSWFAVSMFVPCSHFQHKSTRMCRVQVRFPLLEVYIFEFYFCNFIPIICFALFVFGRVRIYRGIWKYISSLCFGVQRFTC